MTERFAVARRILCDRGIGDHRRLGRLYLIYALALGLWGGLDALLLRTVLATPETNVALARTFDAFFTTHGLTMLFLFALPAIWGFAYAVVPDLVEADGTAFPVLAEGAFWLLVPAAIAIRSGTIGGLLGVVGFDPVATGWTLYPPLSTTMANPAVDVLLVGLLLVVCSATVTDVDLATTIVWRRSIRWRAVDTYTWTVLTSACMTMLAFPVLALAVALLLVDRALDTTMFVGGGDALRWQHLFWFFAHPLVYVLVLPAMGIVGHVIARFSGRRLYGHRSSVYSTLAIGVIAFTVWGHHLYVTGLDPRVRVAFMFLTLAVALPSAVKFGTWVATLWGGALRITVPLLFVLAGIAIFVVGGVTGVFLAVAPINILYNGTYYVVAHFHFMLVGLVAFALLAAAYYWYPLLTGNWYDRSLARIHFWLTAVGIVVTFGALLIVGIMGLPRRVATYPEAFTPLHQLATVGAYVVAIGQVVFVANLLRSRTAGKPAGSDPWSLGSGPNHVREWRRVDDE